VPSVVVPALDRPALEAEDDQRAANGEASRFAVSNAVTISPDTHGVWEVADAAWSLWRLRVGAPGSSHVNLGFGRFVLPPTGRLQIFSEESIQNNSQSFLRPFTSADNSVSRELWTPVVDGDKMVIELYVQTAQKHLVDLLLTHIGSGYRYFGAGYHAVRDGSGSCNVDVVCPQGAAWVAEIPSVAAISTGGSIFCTGVMLNNTAQDGRNFFLTANHCGVSAGSLVCYWNYQRSVCGSGSGPLNQFTTGAQHRASYSTSDFHLVELNSTPNPAWGVTYAGWSRSTADASSAVAIHHPQGDDKKISFEYQSTTTTSYGGTSQPGNGSHVRVIDWDLGTTEPGSSGSPLFDQNHRVIGQLHGGGAACGNNQSDWYGRISRSWTGGGGSSSRLSNWLDPIGTGQTTLDTLGSNAASASVFGLGCYTSYATYHEGFSGSFDMSGSGSSTVSIVMTPSGNGYAVTQGGNNWSNPTTPDLGLSDDGVTSPLSLGFNLSFPGGNTSQVRMCSNGYVWLNGSSTGADYTPSSSELTSESPRLAPFWMDCDPTSGGSCHFHTASGVAYFTWQNVPPWNSSSSATNTFQAAVYSSGVVEYRWRSVSNFPGGGLVGWSRGNGVQDPPAIDISASLPFSVSVDADGLEFIPQGRPVQGTTMTMTMSNIPAGTSFGGVFLGFTQYPSGLSLASLGMNGCYQYCSQEFTWLAVLGGSTYNFQLGIPTGSFWTGTEMFSQAATLTPGVNALGALASNGIALKFDTQ